MSNKSSIVSIIGGERDTGEVLVFQSILNTGIPGSIAAVFVVIVIVVTVSVVIAYLRHKSRDKHQIPQGMCTY